MAGTTLRAKKNGGKTVKPLRRFELWFNAEIRRYLGSVTIRDDRVHGENIRKNASDCGRHIRCSCGRNDCSRKTAVGCS
jgi:hypothetical protein